MSTVDERIVDMQFNNKQFESGIQTSLKSLDNLKNGLNLDGAAKSLSNLDRVGKSFSLAGIAQGVDVIASRFTTLGIMGVTALANITNAAVNTGKRMIAALTIDPIKTGLQEYETKMGAIQTILTNTASKGTTLTDVNKALAELNEYADKTIYNFAEMTRNIGTFTAAGVDLKTATSSIKGIANLAAGSGSNAQQASTAMYQLSQAISAGSVKLMDWNSVVNAGMGGELFQNALKKTAKQMGVFVDESVPFRLSLEQGWLTSEVLTKTLSKFAEDEALVKAATQVKTFTQLFDTMKESVQSGWAVSWENIIGDKEQSAKTLTAINDAFGNLIGPAADARNAMLQFWNQNGGREALIEGITNAFKGLASIIKPIKEGFREIFPPMLGNDLIQFSKGFRDLMVNFKIGEETAKNLKNTFKGLFALLDIGKMAISALLNGLVSFIKYLSPAGNGILSFTGSVGEFLVALRDAIKTSDTFNVAVQKIGAFFKPAADMIKNAITVIVEAFKSLATIDMSGLDALSDRAAKRFAPFTKLGEIVKEAFSKIAGVLEKLAPTFYKLGSAIGKVFDAIGESISKALDDANFDPMFDLINGGLFATILYGIKKFIDSLTKITDNSGSIVGGLKDIFGGVTGSLTALQDKLKAGTLMKIAIAIGILAASLTVLSLIDSEKLTSSLAAISVLFIELFGSMAVFEKLVGGSGFDSIGKITRAMLLLSISVLILAVAMTKLAELDWNGIAKGLVAVAALSGILIGSSKLLEQSSGKMMKGALGFILFAAAINILADAVKKLGELDPTSLTKGLIGVGVLAAELSLFMKVTDLSGMGITKAVGILVLAAALNVMAEAVRKLGELKPETLVKGIASLGLVLSELSLFVNSIGDVKRVISTAIGLTILGAAMLIFAQAIGMMGSLSWEQIGKGLATMAGALLAVTVALNFMPKNMISTGLGLIGVATALLILSTALQNMGNMSWEEIARGLVALAGSLFVITLAVNGMNGAIPGAAALLIVAAALAVLAPVLKTLGSMSLAEIGKGLLALAGVFAVLGLGALVLAPLVPVLLALGVAVALLGVGCMAVGVGILAFATGLSALAVAGTAGAAALVVIVTSLISLIPQILKRVGEGIIEICNVIAGSTVAITEAITVVIVSLMKAIAKSIPAIVDTAMLLLTKLLEAVVSFIPKMVDAGMKLIIGILKGVADNIKEVVATAIKIVVNFIDGIASMIPKVIQAGFDLILSFINGLTDAIRKNTPLIIEAMGRLITAMLDAAVQVITAPVKGVFDIGKNLVQGLIDGIKNMFNSAKQAVENLGKGILDGLKNFLGIHSPSRVMRDEVGVFIVQGIAEGITKDMSAEQAAEKKAQNIANAFKSAFSKIDLSDTTANLEYQLWSKTSGANASPTDQTNMKANLLAKQFNSQKDKIELAKAQWQTMVDNMGADSDEAVNAYNTYLQEQIKLTDLAKQIKDARAAEQDMMKNNSTAYYDFMRENREALLAQGFTMEQIQRAATRQSGFDPTGGDSLLDSMATNVEEVVTSAMGTVKTVYEDTSDKTFSGLLTGFDKWGGKYADALGDGFINSFKMAMEKIKGKLDEFEKELDTRLENLRTKINNVLDMEINTSFTISPVLDLSGVASGSETISSMLNSDAGINVSASANKASSINNDSSSTGQDSSPSMRDGNSFTFQQYNYSPTPLSRIDIYRQTNNQFSALKGLVSNT